MADNISEQEYSLQHYQFTPEKFYKDFSEMIIRELALVVHQTMKCVSLQSDDEMVREYLIKVFSKFHQDWSQCTITILQAIKPLIYEFFKIPSNVLLPADIMQSKHVTEEQISKLQNEVSQLEKDCLQEITRKEMYLAELEALSHLEPIQKNLDKSVAVIKQFQTTMNEIQEFDELIRLNTGKVLKKKQNDESIHDSKDDITEQGYKFVVE